MVTVGEADHGDAPECVVRFAVAATVQSVTHGLARRCLDRARAAEGGKRGFVTHPVGVVAGCDQEHRRDFRPYAVDGQQRWVGCSAQLVDVTVEFGDLRRKRLVTASQVA